MVSCSRLVCLGALICVGPVVGAPIAIVNPGFESPVMGPNQFSIDPPGPGPTGWTNPGPNTGGVFYPTIPSWGYAAPQGNQLLYLNGCAYEQTLAANIVANRTYTLRVAVVHRPGYFNNTYTIQLKAGNTVVAQNLGTVSPPLGGSADAVVVYTSPASGPTIGQPIRIRFTGDTQANFDNVRLDDGAPVACPGDINGDGFTNAADFTILAGNFGSAVPAGTAGDLNNDGIVNAADFVILAGDFGCP